MSSAKKSKSASKAPTTKPARSAPRPDAADRAAEAMSDVEAELEDVVEGARLGMVATRQRADDLIAFVQAKKALIARHFYDIGKALAELQRDKLYIALGMDSFAQLLRERDLLSLSQAKKLIAVAESFDRAEALKLGTEKAYALVRVAKTTPEDDTPRQLAAGSVRVAGKTKKSSTLSATELRQAARTLQAKARSPRKPTAEEKSARKDATSLQASLRRAGAKGAIVEAKKSAGEWKLVVTVAATHADTLRRLMA